MPCNKIPTSSSSYVLKKIEKEFQLKALAEHAFQIFSWLHVDKGFSTFQEHSKSSTITRRMFSNSGFLQFVYLR